MDRNDDIVWTCMAFLHQGLILERAVWLYFGLRKKDDSEEVSPVGIISGDDSEEESEYHDRKRDLLRKSIEINTHQRAFSYVATREGVDPNLLLKNLPGNPGALPYPGHPRIMTLIHDITDVFVAGKVNQKLLDELVRYYEDQLEIFRSKLEPIEEDDDTWDL